MVGGSAAAMARARPLFECMGKTIVHVGDSGAGQVAKAANQMLTGVGVLAVAEALNFARRNGVDPAKVREALMGGSANSRILDNHGQRMLDRNFNPGFKSWMHQKDMNIVLQTAYKLGVCLPATAAAAQMFNAMVGSGLGEEDSVAMIKLLEQLSRPSYHAGARARTPASRCRRHRASRAPSARALSASSLPPSQESDTRSR